MLQWAVNLKVLNVCTLYVYICEIVVRKALCFSYLCVGVYVSKLLDGLVVIIGYMHVT